MNQSGKKKKKKKDKKIKELESEKNRTFLQICHDKFLNFALKKRKAGIPLDIIIFIYFLYIEASISSRRDIFTFPKSESKNLFGDIPVKSIQVYGTCDIPNQNCWTFNFSPNVPKPESIVAGPYALSLTCPDWKIQFPPFSGKLVLH